MAKIFKEDLRTISVDMIHPNPEQPRQHFDQQKLQELGKSLRKGQEVRIIVILHPKKKTPT